MKSEHAFEEEWDKKKIAITIAIGFLIFSGYVAVRNFSPLGSNQRKAVQATEIANITPSPQVTMTLPHFSLPSSADMQGEIQNIQKQVAHLDVNEVASSSPQIQQILQQIQSLPHTPSAVAKNVCEELCKKL